jgi:hypothetical protein
MQFVLRRLTVVDDEHLEATFVVVHRANAMRGEVTLVVPFAQADTIEQITMRAGEMLELAMVEADD